MSRVATALPIAALLFNCVLCLLSTRGMHTGKALVSAIELGIVASAVLLSWRGAFPALTVAGSVLGLNLVALLLLSGATDLKIAVDCAIPAAFYLLGRRFSNRRGARRLMGCSAALVLAFGCYEMIDLASFEHYFHVFDYYVQKGALSQAHAQDTGTLLAENGMRPGDEGRQLLPGLLSLHRAGSVFLEPVSAGDFAAICVAWVVATRDWSVIGWLTLLAGLATGVLADARFSIVSAAAIAVFLATPVWRWRGLVACLPAFALAALLLTGAISTNDVDNSMLGRLTGSGDLLNAWSAWDWLGLGGAQVTSMDTGYSHVIGNLGILCAAGLWIAACLALPKSGDVARLFAAITVYMTLSLGISSSALSIKTAGLMWFALGALAREAAEPVSEMRFAWRRKARFGIAATG
jgi:putative polymerase